MHSRHIPQALPITAGEIDQPLVGQVGFPVWPYGYCRGIECCSPTINCRFERLNSYRTSCIRQRGVTQAAQKIRSIQPRVNIPPCASTSAPAAEAATANRTRRCATSPGRSVNFVFGRPHAGPDWGGQGNVRPSFFLPTSNRLASRAQKARAGSSSAGPSPIQRTVGAKRQPSCGGLVLTSLIHSPRSCSRRPGHLFLPSPPPTSSSRNSGGVGRWLEVTT